MEHPPWSEIAESTGFSLEESQIERLVKYRDWLATEAVKTGAIGPEETTRLDIRHIGDSLLFSRFIADDTPEVWDLGSGAGLPGIPLSILHPETQFVLIDRSERRVDLMRRVTRVLELENVEVAHVDISDLDGSVGLIVSRATIPPDRAYPLVEPLLSPDGTAVFGGSWSSRPHHRGWETVEVGTEVLDQPVWLLIMRRR